MKKILLILAVTAISFSVTAQEKRETPKQSNGSMQHMHHGGKHRNGKMMKELNFSDAQKTQLKANREEYKMKIESLKKEQGITLKDFNTKKAVLDKEQRSKMQALLSPEQKTKMAEMKAKKEQANQERYNKHFEKMKTELSLTEEQASKLKAQHEIASNNMKAIRDNESLSREEKREQIRKIKETSMEQRKNVLNAEQLKKLEEMHKNKMKKEAQ